MGAAAAALPPHLKVRGATGKYALREAVRELIPRRVYARPKHPFLAPPAVGGDPLWRMMQDVVRSRALEALPFFDAVRVRRLFDRLHTADAAERIALDPVVCVVVSACLLQERFGL